MTMPDRPRWCGKHPHTVATYRCRCKEHHLDEGQGHGATQAPAEECIKTHYLYRCDECGYDLEIGEFTMEVKWHSIPSYGDLMTMKEWIECVEDGGFIDYDGNGSYARDVYGYGWGKQYIKGSTVYPSDLTKDKVDLSHTHILWFNR